MTTLAELVLHIHAAGGQPCVACGDSDDGSRAFTTDVGMWNRDIRSCSPSDRVRPDYTVSGREDPDTSALKDERFGDPQKEPR